MAVVCGGRRGPYGGLREAKRGRIIVRFVAGRVYGFPEEIERAFPGLIPGAKGIEEKA